MLVKFFQRVLKFCWFLPGFLLWASFPPMGERFDCFFALAPLMWFSRNRKVSQSTWLWFFNGLLFWVATLAWMPAIVKNNGPWPLVVLGWFALAAYCALFFAAFGWMSSMYWRWSEGVSEEGRVKSEEVRRFFGLLVVEPVMWCGLELVRSRLFGGFAWNQLGVAPVNAGFGAPAALGGVYLVSAVVILVNGTIASIAERFLKRDRRWWKTLETFLPFAMIFALYSYAPCPQGAGEEEVSSECRREGTTDNLGERRREGTTDNFGERRREGTTDNFGEGRREGTTDNFGVALVQRNFSCCFKADETEDPIAVYSNLCANVALLKPDLVVLPESAMAEIGAIDGARARAFADWLMRLTGAKAVIAGGGRAEGGRLYNSAALYSLATPTHSLASLAPFVGSTNISQTLQAFQTLQTSQSSQTSNLPNLQPSKLPNLQPSKLPNLQTYDKVHLVPFGEFIPGDKIFPALQKLAPVGSCTPGELKLLGDFGVAICYEDTDSALCREYARRGAKALVFITNDSWFSHSQETISHAWQATARAIETGLPVIRVGNSGVTGIIYPDGKANWLCGADGRPLVDARGTLFDRVKLASDRVETPYTRWGDWPLGILFGLLTGVCFLIYYKNHYEQRRIVSLQIG